MSCLRLYWGYRSPHISSVIDLDESLQWRTATTRRGTYLSYRTFPIPGKSCCKIDLLTLELERDCGRHILDLLFRLMLSSHQQAPWIRHRRLRRPLKAIDSLRLVSRPCPPTRRMPVLPPSPRQYFTWARKNRSWRQPRRRARFC